MGGPRRRPGLHLQNVNSLKCLDVSDGKDANGTKIQIWTCHSNPAQTWEFNLHATTSLRNTGTDKCLDLHDYTNGHNSWLWTCNGSGPQQFDVKPSGHNGTVPPKAQFDRAKAGITNARAGAAKQLDVLKAQLAVAHKAATDSDTAEQAAYATADQQGAPRGRGLLVGQQKAQVTQGAAAALQAMVKAGETAEAATRASGGQRDHHRARARTGRAGEDGVVGGLDRVGRGAGRGLHGGVGLQLGGLCGVGVGTGALGGRLGASGRRVRLGSGLGGGVGLRAGLRGSGFGVVGVLVRLVGGGAGGVGRVS
ncbi:ricin-type beta-trefoil lectin domain protein [Streptomyces sp. NPDC020801]|uniref:ricin-type beta-trefoil lectin domain protein n=1 Tax=Streptomyces sp. NPDC020801 TaxID=3365093 RepID=UPI003798CFA8